MMDASERVVNYWTIRAHDFAVVRENELKDSISDRWMNEMKPFLQQEKGLSILDAGTGTGYFSILLARQGHFLTGIDLTEAMIREAGRLAQENGVSPEFLVMDVQNLSFEDASFDVVVTRNLTWTLPNPDKAYREWHRVLRPGGVLVNFDADYAQNVRDQNQKASAIDPSGVYGHFGITPELSAENARITLQMPAANETRPMWDLELAKEAGFTSFGTDLLAGRRILRERDLSDAPLFLVWAKKVSKK